MTTKPKTKLTTEEMERRRAVQERLRGAQASAEQKFIRPRRTPQKVNQEPTAPDLSNTEVEQRKQRLRDLGIPLPTEARRARPTSIIEPSTSLFDRGRNTTVTFDDWGDELLDHEDDEDDPDEGPDEEDDPLQLDQGDPSVHPVEDDGIDYIDDSIPIDEQLDLPDPDREDTA